MRKVSILVAVLLLVSSFSFAQMMEFEWEAEASATWGVQLDEMATGFKNDAEFTASATIKEEATEEFGEGDVYGWIEVEDVVVEIDEDIASEGEANGVLTVGIGEITGRVYAGPAYLEVFSDNVATINLASQFSEMAQDIFAFGRTQATALGDLDIGNPVTGITWATAGAAIGFEVPGLAAIQLGVGSATPWDDTDTDTKNEYGFSIDVELTPVEMVTVDLISNMHFGDTSASDGNLGQLNNPASVGLGLEYEMPMGDMTLTPKAGVDVFFMEDAAEDLLTDIEIGVGVNLLWPGLGTDEDDQTIFGVEDELTSGVGLGFAYAIDQVDADNSNSSYGVKLGFYEDEGDDGLLPIVGAAAIINYNALIENTDTGQPSYAELGLGVEFNADLGVVAPYFGVYTGIWDLGDELGDVDGDGEDGDDFLYLQVGTDINVISNTTFTIEYNSGDLGTEADPTTWGDVYADGSRGVSAAQAGELSIETTVSF